MQVHHSMDHLPAMQSPVVTVGSFDGVHAGHRTIIRRLNHLAGKTGGESVLVTFYPHPRKVLYPESEGKGLRMIYDQEEKCRMLEGTGLDHLVIVEFTRAFARTSSEEFVENYLLGKLGASTIVVGFNHFFGHNRTGNYDSLYLMSETRGFIVEEIPAQEIQQEIVSSTRIRNALSEGNIQRANASLEHHFIMQGEYRRCETTPELPGHLCLEIGPRDPDKLIPPPGTYAVSFGKNGTGRPEYANRKGLVVIVPEAAIRLYAATDPHPEGTGTITLRFHRRMTAGVNGGLRGDMKAVNELLY